MRRKARTSHRIWRWAVVVMSAMLLAAVLMTATACEDLDSDDTSTTEMGASSTAVEASNGNLPATEDSTTTTQAPSPGSTTTTTSGGFPVFEGEFQMEGIILPLSWTRFESDDSHLQWLGQWHTGYGSQLSGNSYRYVNENHAGYIVEFEGTQIRLICSKTSASGIAEITLDNEASEYADLYASSTSNQQISWTSDVLDYGEHTLLVGWTGQKNASSSSTFINIDAVEVKGDLVD